MTPEEKWVMDGVAVVAFQFAGAEHARPDVPPAAALPSGSYLWGQNGLSSAGEGQSADRLWGRLHLLATSAGGRSSATPAARYRCVLRKENVGYECQLEYGDGRRARPDSVTSVELRFLDPEAKLSVALGDLFEVWDGHVVGELRVTAAL